MKDLGTVTIQVNRQSYQVAAEIDTFGPLSVLAWRCGSRPIEFTFDADGLSDQLLNEINTYVMNVVYGNKARMPVPEDFEDALIVPV